MKSLPDELSSKQLSQLLGLSQQYLGKLERDGVIEKRSRDRYPIDSVTRAFAHIRRKGLGPASWNEARTKKMQESALLATLTREEREGALVRTDRLKHHWETLLYAFRQAIIAVPRKLATPLANCRAPESAEEILRKELYACLTRLSKGDFAPAPARKKAAR